MSLDLFAGSSCTYDCGCKWERTAETQREPHWTVVCEPHSDQRQIDTWTYNDGGREDAGYKGSTSDCVTRSIAIATGLPYERVYDELNELAKRERPRDGRKRSSARTGVHRGTYEKYLRSLGWTWVPTMQIGQGCQTHLRADELPSGRLVVRCSKHVTAVIDGVIHDTGDPSRDGTRCVYGYFLRGEQ